MLNEDLKDLNPQTIEIPEKVKNYGANFEKEFVSLRQNVDELVEDIIELEKYDKFWTFDNVFDEDFLKEHEGRFFVYSDYHEGYILNDKAFIVNEDPIHVLYDYEAMYNFIDDFKEVLSDKDKDDLVFAWMQVKDKK